MRTKIRKSKDKECASLHAHCQGVLKTRYKQRSEMHVFGLGRTCTYAQENVHNQKENGCFLVLCVYLQFGKQYNIKIPSSRGGTTSYKNYAVNNTKSFQSFEIWAVQM